MSWVLACALCLTGCADPPPLVTAVEVVTPDYPAALFHCAPWPAPDEAPRDLFELVAWLARARAAHLDCAWRLACAGRLVRGEGDCGAAGEELGPRQEPMRS